MAEIGEVAELTVMREAPMGVFLNGGPRLGDILLPKMEVPKGTLLYHRVSLSGIKGAYQVFA